MSRIIGGAGKGRRLKTAAGDSTRPTGARVRQSLFDILAPVIPGCRFLDAFAGNGGVGLEALSRGAATVVLVDKASAAVEAAKENARALAQRRGRGAGLPAGRPHGDRGPRPTRGCGSTSSTWTRPTTATSTSRCSRSLGEGPLLAEGGVVVAEHFHKRPLPETIGALTRTREKRVGDHCLSFYRRASGDGRAGRRRSAREQRRRGPESGREEAG